MQSLQRQVLVRALRYSSLLSMIICFAFSVVVVAAPVRERTPGDILSSRVQVQDLLLFLVFLPVWNRFFARFGLYHSRSISTPWSEIRDGIKATFFGTAAMYVFAGIFGIQWIGFPFLLVFLASSGTMTVLWRMSLRHVLKGIRSRGRNLRHALIIGTNPRAVRLMNKLESRSDFGFNIVGFADDGWPGLEARNIQGRPVVCDLKRLKDFLRRKVVDEVFVCLPMQSLYPAASRVVEACEEQGIVVRVPSDLFNVRVADCRVDEIGGDTLLTLSSGALKGGRIYLKRVLDIVVSFLLLLLLAPVFALAALAVKATSTGPVFFHQERMGLNKRRFRIYKFRTMICDAERKQADLEHMNEAGGPVFKIRNDPRITPVGRILRKTSIDELPQLLNVFKGEMSLVGPRPLPVRDYEGFDRDPHRRRFSVRPGITCLWQVRGRSNISFERWMELDLEYIDRWSLWLDVRILLETVPAVLKGMGAA